MQNNSQNESTVWQEDDFYYHPKSFGWYLLAVLATALISGLAWLLSGRDDIVSPIIIAITLFALTIYAGRKPQKKNFELKGGKILINSEPFFLSNFAEYWVEEFETHIQISLIGIKRTTMPIGLCIKDNALAKRVISHLRDYLPESEPSQNPVDWLTRKIKF